MADIIIPDLTKEEKLAHLISILESVEANDEWLAAFNMDFYLSIYVHHSCGFAGCAVGWAAKDKMFNSMGFLVDGMGDIVLKDPLTHETRYSDTSDAISVFLDITDAQYDFLFEPGAYDVQEIPFQDGEGNLVPEDYYVDGIAGHDITPRMVIDRIEYLMEHPDVAYCED